MHLGRFVTSTIRVSTSCTFARRSSALGERGIVVAVQGTRHYSSERAFAAPATLRSLCRAGAVLPAAALLNLIMLAAGGVSFECGWQPRSKAAAAAGLKSFYPAPSVDGGALAPTMALKRHAGLPANIWTLLEDMDFGFAEPAGAALAGHR